jgi:D-arabinose 5-phosphate isomerase GutQ
MNLPVQNDIFKMKNYLKQKDKSALVSFISIANVEIQTYLRNMPISDLEAAANLILKVQTKGGRVHITGIGKPSHLAGYISSLMSSTGTPTFFLHGTEAVHGSCGQLAAGDVVICISNSGETAELKATVRSIKNNDCKIIGVTGNPQSWLAKQSDIHLLAHVNHEGGPLNRAPRLSNLAQSLVLQALSVLLQSHNNIKLKDYVRWHPSGSLGLY